MLTTCSRSRLSNTTVSVRAPCTTHVQLIIRRPTRRLSERAAPPGPCRTDRRHPAPATREVPASSAAARRPTVNSNATRTPYTGDWVWYDLNKLCWCAVTSWLFSELFSLMKSKFREKLLIFVIKRNSHKELENILRTKIGVASITQTDTDRQLLTGYTISSAS